MYPKTFIGETFNSCRRCLTHMLIIFLIGLQHLGIVLSEFSLSSTECPTARLEIFWFYRISNYEIKLNPPGSLTLDWCIEATNCSLSSASSCNFYRNREQRSPRSSLHGFLNFHLDIPLAVDYLITLTFKDHALWSQPIIAELQLPEQDERNISTVVREYVYSEDTPNRILRLRAQRQCPPNRYGLHCTRICVPQQGIFKCGVKGERICEPGFTGTDCLERDVCHPNPCARHAQCITVPGSRTPVCICNDGTTNPDCYKNPNPCKPSPCQNDGLCEVDEWHMATCKCTDIWTGSHCEIRRLACEEARERLLSQSDMIDGNASGIDLCLNGGQCFENMYVLGWGCVCPDGWTGQRCEKNMATKNLILAIFLALISVILTILIIVLLARRFKYKRMNQYINDQIHIDSITEPDESNENDETISSEHVPCLQALGQTDAMNSMPECRDDAVDLILNAPPRPAKPDRHVRFAATDESPEIPPKPSSRLIDIDDHETQPIRPTKALKRRDVI